MCIVFKKNHNSVLHFLSKVVVSRKINTFKFGTEMPARIHI